MEIKDITKEYSNNDLTILWQAKKCIHSEKCWRGLPEVFRYGKKPWIDPEAAKSKVIMNQIDLCPSGALSYKTKNENLKKEATMSTKINLAKNGPVLMKGQLEIEMPDGSIREERNVALCRCGSSNNKPYCDGTHTKIDFKAD